MSEEYLHFDDSTPSSADVEYIKPKTTKKEGESKETGIDTQMMYDILSKKKTIRQYCAIKQKSENDLLLEFKMNIHWINSLLGLKVPGSEITFENILGPHCQFWIAQVKSFRRTQELDDLDPHERYINYFKGLKLSTQKEHLRDLQNIADKNQNS